MSAERIKALVLYFVEEVNKGEGVAMEEMDELFWLFVDVYSRVMEEARSITERRKA